MGAIEFTTVTDDAGFRQLERDWRALFDAAGPAHCYHSFDWCWHAWRYLSSKRGRRLRILVGRVDGQTVLILPLMIVGPYLRGLGAELFETNDVLVLATPQRDVWIEAALNAAKGLGGSALLLRNVRQDGDLGAFFERRKTGIRSRHAGKSSFIRLDAYDDWQDYLAALPDRLMSDQRRQWKRLAALANPGRFEIVEGLEAQTGFLHWLHAAKSDWLDARKGMPHGGLFGSDDYRDFLFSTVASLAAQQRVMLCRIVSGAQTLAGAISFILGDRLIFFIFVYDPAWSSLSPGRLLMAKTIEWCFAHRIRIFDLLQGPDRYKDIWTNGALAVHDYFVPLNLAGRLIEKWHGAGCSRFFAGAWFDPVSRAAPGWLHRAAARLTAQQDILAEMKPL